MMRIPHNSKGHAVVEVALMAPWIFLLFIGVFDFCFYSYAAISVENAARAAAIYTSSTGAVTDQAGACRYAFQELQNMPNVGTASTCSALPLKVTLSQTTIDSQPATQVAVTYQTIQLIPIPWLPGIYNITRVVSMMVAQ